MNTYNNYHLFRSPHDVFKTPMGAPFDYGKFFNGFSIILDKDRGKDIEEVLNHFNIKLDQFLTGDLNPEFSIRAFNSMRHPEDDSASWNIDFKDLWTLMIRGHLSVKHLQIKINKVYIMTSDFDRVCTSVAEWINTLQKQKARDIAAVEKRLHPDYLKKVVKKQAIREKRMSILLGEPSEMEARGLV